MSLKHPRRTIHFSGRVQGVGFRYTVEQLARSYPVVGYVKNLPDTRVELVVEAEPAVVDDLLRDVASRMDGFIRETRAQESPGTGEFSSFEIRY